MLRPSFRGEGRFTVFATVVAPLLVLLTMLATPPAVVSLGAWWFGPRVVSGGVGLSAMLYCVYAIWLIRGAGAARLVQRAARCVRGERPPHWRIEVDDVGVRRSDSNGQRLELDWFEFERCDVARSTILLWLRAPRPGVTVVALPRKFFPAQSWEPMVALVHAKLPRRVATPTPWRP